MDPFGLMNDSQVEEERVGAGEEEAGHSGKPSEKGQEYEVDEARTEDDKDARIKGRRNLNRFEQGEKPNAHGDTDVAVSYL